MVGRWSNTREGEGDVLQGVQAVLDREGVSPEELLTDQELCQTVVAETAKDVISMLRRNGVTGAFLVLNCPNGESAYPGFYVRDYDPSSYSEGNTDLLMERGLPAVARDVSIALDSYWDAFFHLEDPDAPEAQFFFAPIREAERVDLRSRSAEYFYHWSERFRLGELDREVITYSIPLIWEDGTILGVLGVDLNTDYLAGQLNYSELEDDRAGAYFLGISRDGGVSYEAVCTSGPNFKAYFGQTDTLSAAPGPYSGIVTLESGAQRSQHILYGAVRPLKLYNVNTPFEEEQWALIGILDDGHLLEFSRSVQTLVLVTALVCLIIGVVLMFLAARTVTRPIARLAALLKKSDPDKPIRLPRLQITEIDALTEAIEIQSNAAAESAARISKIISMTHIPIGVFEYQKDLSRVFCSRSLFEVLGWPIPEAGDCYLDAEEFRGRLDGLSRNLYDEDEQIYRMPQAGNTDRWVQLTYREEGVTVLGAFQDVTRDMEAKRKMEYERDFDILTDLYNRRAFDQRVRRLFSGERREKLGVSALLMFDLDNLKYVNDTYGHDYGDRYIQSFGKSLEYFYRCRSVVGRRSGDEFNVFLYGHGSQDEIRACLAEFREKSGENALSLPGGASLKIRASGGLAWYPADAAEFEDLLRMADFAMYSIKHSVKGSVQEFDRQDYEERSILVQGQDALNRLIDGRLVRYALQPVVCAADGSIYGYEMLMRPQLEQLSDLKRLFLLAKSESKPLQIERLTWFESLKTFDRMERAGKLSRGAHVFVNSISNQTLPPQDVEQLESLYGHLLDRVVFEITEGEEANAEATGRKKRRAEHWGGQVALDDFGTGFNSESVLIDMAPDLVKVDMSIIRDIDTDPDRLAMLKNLIGYAKERGIRVLAEGVETRRELETVIACGVDYLQGYYLARPDFNVHPIPHTVREEIAEMHRRYLEKSASYMF